MRLWMFTTLFLIAVLTLHGLGQWYDVYGQWWWYDVVMHFLGGAVMGCFAMLTWQWLVPSLFSIEGKIYLFQCVWVLGFVGLIGIGWEWSEALADAFINPVFALPQAQPGLIDTMFDFYFDLLGAAVAYAFCLMYDTRKNA